MSEHDNDTCPHLVRASLLEAENARLKADVNELAAGLKLASEVGIKIADEVTRLKAEVDEARRGSGAGMGVMLDLNNQLVAENTRLKAEVERLRASSFVTAVPVEQYERLIKAGDAMAEALLFEDGESCKEIADWNAAKEGKPSV